MIIEFELQGSKCLHKGLFDTNGLWIKYEAEIDDALFETDDDYITGYKIYSHFSFAFFHTNKAIVDKVYERLLCVLRGAQGFEIEGAGHIRRLNK